MKVHCIHHINNLCSVFFLCFTILCVLVLSILCLIEDDECQSLPCMNGGTCVNRINRYQCVCEEGYAGVNCEFGKG